MVNHFASLLLNTNLSDLTPKLDTYLLGDETDAILIGENSPDDFEITTGELYTSGVTEVRKSFKLINRNYTQFTLPSALQRMYNLLFPSGCSGYYKHFLLYCYLRIVDSSDKAKDVELYDSRLTYKLSEAEDYFKVYRVRPVKSNNPDYKLSIYGRLKPAEDYSSFLQEFVVKQIDDTAYLQIVSATELKYLKQGKTPSKSVKDMETLLSLNGDSSYPIYIGDTGLYGILSGPFQTVDKGFTDSSDKIWAFSAEAPANFNFQNVYNLIKNNTVVLDDMFDFGRNLCNGSYERMWKTHYNNVYSFAGLLLAYVERVNLVCQRKLM